MSELSAPLVPSDTDVRDLDGFMLNVERLMASELVALSSHEVVAAAMFLWCRAWKQLPAASLPDDERVIAAFARLPLPRFRKIRDQVMRGFVKCSDGRWYHSVLAAEAFSAFGRKQSFQRKRETDAERLKKWRESKRETHSETPNETRKEMHSETRFVAEGQGQGQGQGEVNPLPSSLRSEGPSPNQDEKPSKAVTFKTWLALEKQAGRPAISGYQPVFEYCQTVGIDQDWLQLAWFEFRERYLEDEKAKLKRYIDWRRVFLRAVKERWSELWFFRDGKAVGLTTKGQQAMLAHAGRMAA